MNIPKHIKNKINYTFFAYYMKVIFFEMFMIFHLNDETVEFYIFKLSLQFRSPTFTIVSVGK